MRCELSWSYPARSILHPEGNGTKANSKRIPPARFILSLRRHRTTPGQRWRGDHSDHWPWAIRQDVHPPVIVAAGSYGSKMLTADYPHIALRYAGSVLSG